MKKLVLVFLFLSFIYGIYPQVFTGGDASYNFDNDGSYIDIAPVIGYRVDKLDVGVSPLFSYTMPKGGEDYYSFGARLFSKYSVIESVFLIAEFEGMNYDMGNGEREWIYALPVGAGYRQKISKNVNADFSIMYDLLLDEDSPKENPIFRGGINYSF